MAKQAHFYNNNFINHTSVYKNYKIMIFMTSTLDFLRNIIKSKISNDFVFYICPILYANNVNLIIII